MSVRLWELRYREGECRAGRGRRRARCDRREQERTSSHLRRHRVVMGRGRRRVPPVPVPLAGGLVETNSAATATDTGTAPPVVVLGATGGQGGAVVSALRERGVRVRAVVRGTSPRRVRALAEQNVELAQADLTDAEALAAAMRDAAAAFAVTTPFEAGPAQEVARGEAIIAAAGRAQLPHLVLASVARPTSTPESLTSTARPGSRSACRPPASSTPSSPRHTSSTMSPENRTSPEAAYRWPCRPINHSSRSTASTSAGSSPESSPRPSTTGVNASNSPVTRPRPPTWPRPSRRQPATP